MDIPFTATASEFDVCVWKKEKAKSWGLGGLGQSSFYPPHPLRPADDMPVGIIWAVKPERHRTDESEIQLHDFSIQIQ